MNIYQRLKHCRLPEEIYLGTPMPWISKAMPAKPVIAFDTTMDNIFTDSIRILIHQDPASFEVNKYMVYSFEGKLPVCACFQNVQMSMLFRHFYY